MNEESPTRRRQLTLTERMDIQRARYVELRRRAGKVNDSTEESLCLDDGKSRRVSVDAPPSCHIRLELPMHVQDYLTSIGLRFDSIETDDALGRAVSALAIRLYKTDQALQQAIQTSTAFS